MKLIENIDNYFYSKSQKDTYMMYLMILFVIGFVAFYIILPKTQHYQKTQLDQYNKTTHQFNELNKNNKKLRGQIISFNKEIKNLKLQRAALKKQEDFYTELANLLDFVEFNKQKWGKFVKNLIINAKKEGLKVISFTNDKIFTDKINSINRKMEINVNLKGEYKNLLYFIYHYENKRDLVRIEHINIDKNRNFEIKFTLYGYEK